MGRFLLAPVEAGFKHWHRITLIVREEKFREDERDNQSRLRKRATTAVLDISNEQVTSLGSIMNSFSNDTKGAIDVLTREVYVRSEGGGVERPDLTLARYAGTT